MAMIMKKYQILTCITFFLIIGASLFGPPGGFLDIKVYIWYFVGLVAAFTLLPLVLPPPCSRTSQEIWKPWPSALVVGLSIAASLFTLFPGDVGTAGVSLLFCAYSFQTFLTMGVFFMVFPPTALPHTAGKSCRCRCALPGVVYGSVFVAAWVTVLFLRGSGWLVVTDIAYNVLAVIIIGVALANHFTLRYVISRPKTDQQEANALGINSPEVQPSEDSREDGITGNIGLGLIVSTAVFFILKGFLAGSFPIFNLWNNDLSGYTAFHVIFSCLFLPLICFLGLVFRRVFISIVYPVCAVLFVVIPEIVPLMESQFFIKIGMIAFMTIYMTLPLLLLSLIPSPNRWSYYIICAAGQLAYFMAYMAATIVNQFHLRNYVTTIFAAAVVIICIALLRLSYSQQRVNQKRLAVIQAPVAVHSRKAVYEARGLSPREVEVAELRFQGLSRREITDKLCISLPTVDTHMRNIYRKLEVGSLSEFHALLHGNTATVQ
jgi:DNA-binding CsgD family transcriptional regulator